jgi:hypothetical protein
MPPLAEASSEDLTVAAVDVFRRRRSNGGFVFEKELVK